MCGRFTLIATLDDLMNHFHIDQIAFDYMPRYNIAPGQMIPAIIASGGQRRIGLLKWGLIPSWADDEKISHMLINAKAETVQEKPSFKNSFKRKRCIIPADGFYEWKKSGSSKQPLRIVLKSELPFAMAGLYDTWISPAGHKIHSCTIITTRPNELVQDIHDRMPVILRAEDEEIWLHQDHQDVSLLQSLLKPFPADEMFAYPVSTIVGNVKNEVPECIEKFESATLF